MNVFGYKFASWILEYFYLNNKFNHQLYGLKPSYPILSKEPVTNDVIPTKILSGSVVIRKDVKYFTENGVVFEGESEETKLDAVVMATGYDWNFPFLEDGIIVKEDDRINLYKCIYPPHLKHPTLAILGFFSPLGPGWPLIEMQTRWVVRVFSNKCKLPSEAAMMESIIRRHEINVERYAPSDKISVRVDYVPYFDEIAIEIGCKPNMLRILFTDPVLFKHLLFGPSLPYQYRLEGPHKWTGARNAILTVSERVRYPLSKAHLPSDSQKLPSTFWIKCFLIAVLMIACYESISCVNLILMLLIFFLCKIMKGFSKRYVLVMTFLPFFITFDGFILSFLLTLFIPLIFALFVSL